MHQRSNEEQEDVESLPENYDRSNQTEKERSGEDKKDVRSNSNKSKISSNWKTIKLGTKQNEDKVNRKMNKATENLENPSGTKKSIKPEAKTDEENETASSSKKGAENEKLKTDGKGPKTVKTSDNDFREDQNKAKTVNSKSNETDISSKKKKLDMIKGEDYSQVINPLDLKKEKPSLQKKTKKQNYFHKDGKPKQRSRLLYIEESTEEFEKTKKIMDSNEFAEKRKRPSNSEAGADYMASDIAKNQELPEHPSSITNLKKALNNKLKEIVKKDKSVSVDEGLKHKVAGSDDIGDNVKIKRGILPSYEQPIIQRKLRKVLNKQLKKEKENMKMLKKLPKYIEAGGDYMGSDITENHKVPRQPSSIRDLKNALIDKVNKIVPKEKSVSGDAAVKGKSGPNPEKGFDYTDDIGAMTLDRLPSYEQPIIKRQLRRVLENVLEKEKSVKDAEAGKDYTEKSFGGRNSHLDDTAFVHDKLRNIFNEQVLNLRSGLAKVKKMQISKQKQSEAGTDYTGTNRGILNCHY